ncbi:MAG: hypothetical protein R2772_02435 [Chitinophagales bacterium]
MITNLRHFLIIIFVALLFKSLDAQSGLCDSITPYYYVDLSSNADSQWISPPDIREGNCCGTSFPKRCIEFELLLAPSTIGVIFDIYSGAAPSGSLFYQVNCGPEIPVGEMICLDGPGPHVLTFCKPGANQNEYTIQAIEGGLQSFGANTIEGCNANLYVQGLIESSIVWHEITSGSGQYDSLFSCISACDTTQFSSVANLPDSILIEVCGMLVPNACDFTSEYRCDTVSIQINDPLTIDIDPNYQAICQDQIPYLVSPTVYNATSTLAYEWYDGVDATGNLVGTDSSLTILVTGNYSVVVIDTLFAACSRDTANVFIEVFPNPILSPISDFSICYSESVLIEASYSSGTLSWFSLDSSIFCNNCPNLNLSPDSSISVSIFIVDSMGCTDTSNFNIQVNPPFYFTQSITICANDSFLLPGGSYANTSGSYIDSLTSMNGCDSTWTTIINVLPTYSFNQSASICANDSFLLPSGTYVNAAGTYTNNFTSTNGCDSTWTTTLNVLPTYSFNQTVSICVNDSFLLPGGSYVNSAGTYNDNFTSANGCDSTWTTTINVLPTYNLSQTASICANDSFLLPGGTYVNTAGSYTDNFTSANGCDSTWTTTLNVLPTYSFSQSASICANDSFLLPGGTYVNTAGTYTDNYTSANGCDSTWTTTLNVLPTYNFSQTTSICANDSFLLPGGTYVNTAGSYTDNFSSANGCDSTWTTTLNVLPTYNFSQTASICANDSFLLPGGTYVNTAGSYTDNFTNANGCDSTWTTTLNVLPTYNFSQTASICANDSFLLPGGTYVNATGSYTDNFTNANGCDSTWTTTLNVLPTYNFSQTANIDVLMILSYCLAGTYINTAGTYNDNFTSANGCDSTWTTTLNVLPTYNFSPDLKHLCERFFLITWRNLCKYCWCIPITSLVPMAATLLGRPL